MPLPRHHWANAITAARIVFLPLFIVCGYLDLPYWFAGLFVAHSLVDALDGLVARWLHIQSDLGRRLDTLMDMIVWLPGAVIFLWLSRAEFDTVVEDYPFLLVIPVITALLMNITAFYYVGTFAAIHLYTAKATGALILLLMLVMLVDGFSPFLGYLAAISSVVYHLEATTIYLFMKGQSDEDVLSLWQVIKRRRGAT